MWGARWRGGGVHRLLKMDLTYWPHGLHRGNLASRQRSEWWSCRWVSGFGAKRAALTAC